MKCIRCKKEIADGSMFCSFCGKRQAGAPAVQRKQRRRPRGSGSVYKLSGNRVHPWVAYNNGMIGTYSSPNEAIIALDAFNARNASVSVFNYTLNDVYHSFLASPRYAKIGASGQEGLAVAWSRLDALKERKALSVRVSEYQEIIDTAMKVPKYKPLSKQELAKKKPSEQKRYKKLASQKQEPLGYDGKNRIKQLVSHLYSEMMRLEMTDKNMSELLVLPIQEKSNKRNFTEAEKKVLWKNQQDEYVKMIILYIEFGFRINELLNLKKSAVDWTRNLIVGGSKTEAGKDRIIPITSKVEACVRYFYDKNKRYLLERNNGKISDDYFRSFIFYPTLEKYGIEYKEDGQDVITPHRARHTFVADSVKSKVAPEALKEVAGHAKYSTTVDKYADDLDIEYLRAEMEKKQ